MIRYEQLKNVRKWLSDCESQLSQPLNVLSDTALRFNINGVDDFDQTFSDLIGLFTETQKLAKGVFQRMRERLNARELEIIDAGSTVEERQALADELSKDFSAANAYGAYQTLGEKIAQSPAFAALTGKNKKE